MNPSRTDKLIQYLLAGAMAILAVVLWDTMRDRTVSVGDTAPNFSLVSDSGMTITRDQFGGKVLVLNFWATWCPPCVKETPVLESVHRKLAPAGVVILGVSVDKNEKKYKDFLKRFGVTFQTYRDVEAKIPDHYATYRYPETYVIDRNGKVVQKIIGADWTEDKMVNFLRSLL